jgi:hypothetical protein
MREQSRKSSVLGRYPQCIVCRHCGELIAVVARKQPRGLFAPAYREMTSLVEHRDKNICVAALRKKQAEIEIRVQRLLP